MLRQYQENYPPKTEYLVLYLVKLYKISMRYISNNIKNVSVFVRKLLKKFNAD